MTKLGIETRVAASVRPCLTFRDRAEEAVNFYVSTFKNSKVMNVVRSDGGGLIPSGKLMHATFELDGQEFTAFDGGASFEFSDGFSMVATCQTQDELDGIWAKLSGDRAPRRGLPSGLGPATVTRPLPELLAKLRSLQADGLILAPA